MSELSFRLATLDELPPLIEFMHERSAHKIIADRILKDFKKYLSEASHSDRILIAFNGDKIIGGSAWHLSADKKSAEIGYFEIQEDHRHTGGLPALRLFNETERLCREEGVETLTTDCFTDASKPFLDRLGFKKTGIICGYSKSINSRSVGK